MENVRQSPVIIGLTLNATPLAIMKGDPGYENPEGGVMTVIIIIVVTLSKEFSALITID